ncbi:ABC transporter substrate-binding protein [Variovorax sp. RHLX14]|uniref:ABC transporter substrate-binding protein n=1 Tax=Variovorax sp. RHLX14 TaxID=1259731 RepID=UPI003F44EF34
MLKRRTFTSVAAAMGIVAIAANHVGAQQAKLEKSRISIAVGGKAAFYYLPLTIAEQLGYFKAEGLEVEISDFAGGARALQAVVGGSADVCSGAYEHTLNLQAKNQIFQAFVMQGRAPQIAFGVSTKTMPGYSGVVDLRGKKIGVSAPGSSTNMVANLILSRAGLKAGDVSFVGVGVSAGALTALRSGQIDAISNVDPVMTMLEQKGDVKIISDTRTLKGTQELFGGPMPSGCLYASADFVQKNPNTCQALANAIVHALKWLQTAGPGDIIKTVPENYLLGDRALYLASFDKVREALSTDGMLPADGPKTALNAIASFDTSVKADRIDLAKTFTNEFARRAKDRFKA